MSNDNELEKEYMTGAELFATFPELVTREQKLERACEALMQELETIHTEAKNQSLAENIDNPEVYCSCADAYRMGHTALHS